MVHWHIGASMGGIDEQIVERWEHQPLAQAPRDGVKA